MPIDLKLLAAYDTPTICNTIELFGVRPRDAGYMDSRIQSCFPEMPPAVGYASTATIRCAFARRGDDFYGSIEEQVRAFAQLPGAALVVIQDLDDPTVAATFGEVMCSTYQVFGAAALITSGAARDLDQVRRLGFAAFSNGAICAHGYAHLVAVHCPVRVGGLAVHPGDLIHADANGVTSIPLEIAPELAEAAAEYMKAETFVLDFLKTGNHDVKALTQARRATMDAIASLGRRLGSKRVSAQA